MIDKIKNLFFNNTDNKYEEKNSDNISVNNNNAIAEIIDNNGIYFDIICVNPNIYLAHRGARICIGKGPMQDSFREKSKYVSKVLAKQHESILEHTNIIVLISINKSIINSYLENYTEFFSSLKFCNVISNSDEDKIILLIGGSIRAFIHALRETSKDNYFILNIWRPIICSSIEKEFLINCFKDNLLDENECNYITNCDSFDDTLEDYNNTKVDIPKEIEIGNTVTLIYKNDIIKIYEKVKQYFSIRDVAKVCTISFVFHDVSRSCSHQLVRHRTGISQESQRYVTKEYKYEEDFVNPIYLEKERYKNVDIDKYIDFTDTFRSYNELIEMGIHKEDARGWLPTNVKTKLMQTFTYWGFCKFLELRLDIHAQTEIRLLANLASQSIKSDIEKIKLYEDFINTDNILQDFIKYICIYNSLILNNSDTRLIEEIEDVDDEIKDFNINTEEKAEEILIKSEKYNQLS